MNEGTTRAYSLRTLGYSSELAEEQSPWDPQQRPGLPSLAPEALPLGRVGGGAAPQPQSTPPAVGPVIWVSGPSWWQGAGDCRIQDTE